MSATLPRAAFSVSIDVEGFPDRASLGSHRALDETTGRLLDLFDKYEISATWAVADPAVSAATDRIVERQCGHEIAVRGDSTWVGRDAGRNRFGRELARRAVRGRNAGFDISTLVLVGAELDEDSDLAIKQGITAVHHASPREIRAARPLQPKSLRFGLWSFPVSVTLPGSSRWLPGGGGRRTARAAMDRAIQDRGLFQVAANLSEIALRGRAAQRVLELVLQDAFRRRQHGLLDIGTIGNVAARLSKQYQGQPSRSILRPAA